MYHLRRVDVIHRISNKEQEGPAASHPCARQNFVTFVALEPEPGAEHRSGHQISHQNLAGWPQGPDLVRKKKRNAKYQDRNSNFVEPVGSEPFLEIERGSEILRKGTAGLKRNRRIRTNLFDYWNLSDRFGGRRRLRLYSRCNRPLHFL